MYVYDPAQNTRLLCIHPLSIRTAPQAESRRGARPRSIWLCGKRFPGNLQFNSLACVRTVWESLDIRARTHKINRGSHVLNTKPKILLLVWFYEEMCLMQWSIILIHVIRNSDITFCQCIFMTNGNQRNLCVFEKKHSLLLELTDPFASSTYILTKGIT